MAVIFNVPSIGNQNEKQKGPTCWFYSAKMVRKFHDAYDTNDHDSERRLVSLVRKIITFMDEDLKNPYDQQFGALQRTQQPTSFGGLAEQLKIPPVDESDPYAMVLYAGFMRFAEMAASKASASPPKLMPVPVIDLTGAEPMDIGAPMGQVFVSKMPPSSAEYEAAFKLMLDWGRNSGFRRINILDRLGFEEINKVFVLDALRNIALFDELLGKVGPVWCGGRFEHAGFFPLNDGTTKPFVKDQPGVSGHWIMRQSFADYLNRTHAIVICGVSEKSRLVIYRDPNDAKFFFTMPFDEFSNRMINDLRDANISLLNYKCQRCAQRNGSSCTKQPAKQLKVGMGLPNQTS
jgi:hypothetical protein